MKTLALWLHFIGELRPVVDLNDVGSCYSNSGQREKSGAIAVLWKLMSSKKENSSLRTTHFSSPSRCVYLRNQKTEEMEWKSPGKGSAGPERACWVCVSTCVQASEPMGTHPPAWTLIIFQTSLFTWKGGFFSYMWVVFFIFQSSYGSFFKPLCLFDMKFFCC